jgi:hypothetical protein
MPLPKLRLHVPRRSARSKARDAYRRGAEHGRRWGATADPAEIGRIRLIVRENQTVGQGMRREGVDAETRGLIAAARFAFLVRPGDGDAEDLQAALAFWREAVGEGLEFEDMAEAVEWLRGFGQGAVEGHERAMARSSQPLA